MKFDFVVGNPPYSDPNFVALSNASNPWVLYDAFVFKSCEVANFTALVIPAGWTSKKKAEDYIAAGLKAVHYFPANVFEFVEVRSGITGVFLEQGWSGPLEICTEDKITFTQSRYAPIENIDPESRALLNELRLHPVMTPLVETGEIPYPWGSKGKLENLIALSKGTLALEQSPAHPYPAVLKLNACRAPVYGYTSIVGRQARKHLVVLSYISVSRALGYVMIVPKGTIVPEIAHVIQCDTEKRADLTKLYLESTLVQFIVNHTKFNDFKTTRGNVWDHIPRPPLIQWEADGVESTAEAVDSAINKWLELTPEQQAVVTAGSTKPLYRVRK